MCTKCSGKHVERDIFFKLKLALVDQHFTPIFANDDFSYEFHFYLNGRLLFIVHIFFCNLDAIITSPLWAMRSERVPLCENDKTRVNLPHFEIFIHSHMCVCDSSTTGLYSCAMNPMTLVKNTPQSGLRVDSLTSSSVEAACLLFLV